MMCNSPEIPILCPLLALGNWKIHKHEEYRDTRDNCILELSDQLRPTACSLFALAVALVPGMGLHIKSTEGKKSLTPPKPNHRYEANTGRKSKYIPKAPVPTDKKEKIPFPLTSNLCLSNGVPKPTGNKDGFSRLIYNRYKIKLHKTLSQPFCWTDMPSGRRE